MRTLVASVLLVVTFPAFSMSRSHKVSFVNETRCTLEIRLETYHAVNFDGTRPERFTPDLLDGTELVSIRPAETKLLRFGDGAGGFWIKWQTVGDKRCISSSGVVDLTMGDDLVRIGALPER